MCWKVACFDMCSWGRVERNVRLEGSFFFFDFGTFLWSKESRVWIAGFAILGVGSRGKYWFGSEVDCYSFIVMLYFLWFDTLCCVSMTELFQKMFYDSLCHGGFSCHRSSTNEKQQWFRQFMLDLFFLVWYCMSFSTYFCASLINVFWSRVQTVLGFGRWEGALFSAECGKWESSDLICWWTSWMFPD